MSIVKRITLEVDLRQHPFKEGETLVSYADRVLQETGIAGAVTGVRTDITWVDVSTYGGPCHEMMAAIETVEITSRCRGGI